MAPGKGHLTPNRLDSAWLAAKLDVLTTQPSQALCAAAGSEHQPGLGALCDQACQEHPRALLLKPDGGLWAGLLGWGLSGGDAVRGDGPAEIGACLRALPRAWRRVGLLSLAFAEDFAVIDGVTAQIPWLAVCLPSRWAPADKVGRHFGEVHAPVADNTLLLKAGESLARLVSGPGRWERFVWTLTPQPMLDTHPLRHPWPGWPAQATSDDLAALAWMRTEHQTFIPVHGHHRAVFTIHVELTRLSALCDAHAPRATSPRRDLHDALASMSPAVLAYRGLSSARDRLLQWLSKPGNATA